jgi:hypothetical protein
MRDAKGIVLAEITGRSEHGADLQRALESIPGAYFQVARETVDDPDDTTVVLWRLVELYGAAVEQITRRADAFEALLGEQRRAHLRIVDSEPPERPADFSYQVPTKGAS